MPTRQAKTRRLLLVLLLAALAVVAGSVIAGWQRLVDRYLLYRLADAPAEEKERLLARLLERRCAAATPHLLRRYRERPLAAARDPLEEHRRRVKELLSLGAEAVPYLSDELEAGAAAPAVVLDVLEELGPRARAALPAISSYLESSASRGWWTVEAMEAIGAMGEAAEAAVPALLAFRRHHDRLVRWQLYWTLGRIGPRAREAVPLLLEALQREAGEPLFRAAEALERIEPGRIETRAALVACIDGDEPHAAQAAKALLEAIEKGS